MSFKRIKSGHADRLGGVLTSLVVRAAPADLVQAFGTPSNFPQVFVFAANDDYRYALCGVGETKDTFSAVGWENKPWELETPLRFYVVQEYGGTSIKSAIFKAWVERVVSVAKKIREAKKNEVL